MLTVIAVSNPGSAENMVELLVPELQRRGLYWLDYPALGGTIRENVGNVPGKPFLSKDHPGAKIELSLTIVGPALLMTEEQVAHLHEAGLNEEVVPFNKPVADGSHLLKTWDQLMTNGGWDLKVLNGQTLDTLRAWKG
jgi:hypothetical protein